MRRIFLCLFALFVFLSCLTTEHTRMRIPAKMTIDNSRWRGFNLLGMFALTTMDKGFREIDFKIISDLGFNFVRLPLDYRIYTSKTNWFIFFENNIKKIDEAVQWGMDYDVHVQINLQRATGYCCNSAQLPEGQDLDLWTDKRAQDAFIAHWEMFASRYRSVPPEYLSFNLVNEPANIDSDMYTMVMKRTIDAIKKYNPDRQIYIDGLHWASEPVTELIVERVSQSIHCYEPNQLTHYKAHWIDGYENWIEPVWPMYNISQYLYGVHKQEYKTPLILKADFLPGSVFPKGSEIIINISKVSFKAQLVIKSAEREIYSKQFICDENDPDAIKSIKTQWGYENIYNKDYSSMLLTDTGTIFIENTDGDWLIFNSIIMKIEGIGEICIIPRLPWGSKQKTVYVSEDLRLIDENKNELSNFEVLDNYVKFRDENNIAVVVGEWGVYNQTPHNITLRFMEDYLKAFKKYNLGWALWNFDGPFGIFNSDRADVDYEEYRGYKLDRKMLELLQRY
jgi:aryl-phospho-beta-D-glucosidase BglC (GH1 family)